MHHNFHIPLPFRVCTAKSAHCTYLRQTCHDTKCHIITSRHHSRAANDLNALLAAIGESVTCVLWLTAPEETLLARYVVYGTCTVEFEY